VRAFTPSTWPRSEHQKTAYPLEGAHMTASCEGCHTRAAANSAEAATLGRAARAHAAGPRRLRGLPPGPTRRTVRSRRRSLARGRLLACHSLAAFQPSKYDGRAHADCAFPLEGAHMTVPCQQCHQGLGRPRGRLDAQGRPALRALRFDGRARACRDCHDDPHAGQFAARKDKGACESCHGLAAFAPRTASTTTAIRVPPAGAHARTPCASCHRATKAAASGARVVIYRPTPSRCEACHAATPSDGSGSGAGKGVPLRSTSGR
jgi:hypothetical protein